MRPKYEENEKIYAIGKFVVNCHWIDLLLPLVLQMDSLNLPIIGWTIVNEKRFPYPLQVRVGGIIFFRDPEPKGNKDRNFP